MARKVFISILGVSYYNKTKYYLNEKAEHIETRFIQHASLKLLAKNWDNNDKAIFFLTEQAKSFNWNNPAQTENYLVKIGERDTYKGLSEIINNEKFPFAYEIVDIKNGNNEEEIWNIFEAVYNVLEEDDEVYFDITHAFRSIPMLVMVLINYAKFLKNIKVKSITYGNWEGRDKDNYAPIINLTSFSELQDWTSAANDFVNFGNADKLSTLANSEIAPLAKKYKGNNETVNNLKQISKLLPVFIDNILTCRGKEITNNKEGKNLFEKLNSLKENIILPLSPILDKVKDTIKPFHKEDDLINGFNAVKWCINNNLIQQGFTILQENIISSVCEEVQLDKNIKKNRNIVSSCFIICYNNINEDEWKGDAALHKEKTNEILRKSRIVKELSTEFYNLTTVRNDINHYGYSENTMQPNKLKEKLREYFENISKKLKIY